MKFLFVFFLKKFLTTAIDYSWNSSDSKVFLDFSSGSVVKNLPAKAETWVWFLFWEDPLE